MCFSSNGSHSYRFELRLRVKKGNNRDDHHGKVWAQTEMTLMTTTQKGTSHSFLSQLDEDGGDRKKDTLSCLIKLRRQSQTSLVPLQESKNGQFHLYH